MFKANIRLTLLLLTSSALLVSCSPGPSIFDVFPNPPHALKTNNCDDSLNGDWKLTKVNDATGKNEPIKSDELAARIRLRFTINPGCDNSFLILALKRKNKNSQSHGNPGTTLGQLKTKVHFPAYRSNNYFSFNMRENGSKKNAFMIVRYKRIDDDTLEISLVDKSFLVKAIKTKILSGSISKRFGDPEITANSLEIDTFIQQYSDSIFRLKMTYTRTQQTKWNMKKIFCCKY